MTRTTLFLTTTLLFASPALADDLRQLDAHEHGTGALNIAIEGTVLALELEVPGFDIVGFEYKAKTDADNEAVSVGLALLSDPLGLFALPKAAGCSVTSADAELVMGGNHEGHEHDEHGHDDHGHDDHGHDDHAHDDHGHDDHAHDDHAHDHGNKAETHSEFHAEHELTCSDMDKLTEIGLSYFDSFPNAEALEVQLVTETGATQMTATRDAGVLYLSSAY